MKEELVSIVMHSHNRGQHVEESVRSVISQTYKNWELLFVDDNSTDETIQLMMGLMSEDVRWQREHGIEPVAYSNSSSRIKVSHTLQTRGTALNRNSALRDAKGRWVAFLDAGDLWGPTKLEKQIAFMMRNGYSFSYTKYNMIDEDGEDRGVVIGGKVRVTWKDMKKCCWPVYCTVMYDAQKVGLVQVKDRGNENDFAFWLKVSRKADCYLLDESLASQRSSRHLFSPFPFFYKIKWRYEALRAEGNMSTMIAFFMTFRNLWGGILRKIKYVEKV